SRDWPWIVFPSRNQYLQITPVFGERGGITSSFIGVQPRVGNALIHVRVPVRPRAGRKVALVHAVESADPIVGVLHRETDRHAWGNRVLFIAVSDGKSSKVRCQKPYLPRLVLRA